MAATQPIGLGGGAASTVFAGGTGGGGPGRIQITGDGFRLFESKDEHALNLVGWGNPQPLVLDCGNIGAAQAVTTLIPGGNIINPFPWAWLYDINILVAGHEASPVTATIDVFDTMAAGSAAANSYLSAPFSLSGASGVKGASAKFTATSKPYFNHFDPRLYPGFPQSLTEWAGSFYTAGTRAIPFFFPQGQIFSVRCATTAATGAITNLMVTITLVGSDAPLPIYR